FASAGGCRWPCVLTGWRDSADRGDTRVDEHDLLAGRGIGVELFVLAMKTVLDPVDEIGRVPVETIQRYVDLENLLAVSHLGRALDRHRSLEPRAQPAGRGLL